MKTKNKQTKKQSKVNLGISRITQKTFFIAAAFAYVTQSYMIIHDTVTMLTISRHEMASHGFDMLPFLIYAIPAVVVPLLAFTALYVLSNKKATKSWRAFQSALLVFFVVLAYWVLMAVNNVVFQDPLGYGSTGADSGALLLQLIPPVLSLLLAVAIGFWLKTKEKVLNDLSPRVQKVLVVSLPFFALLQMTVAYTGFTSGGSTDAYDSGALAAAFIGLAVPVAVVGILYLATSKLRTKLQRLFIAIVYAFIGVLVTMTIVSVSFQIASKIDVGLLDSVFVAMPQWASLAVFIGIVIWHKAVKAL